MKCHYIYDRKAGKVLIPGCMGTAVHGIEQCTCRNESAATYKQFERKEFNETVAKLKKEIRELEKEMARINRLLRKAYSEIK